MTENDFARKRQEMVRSQLKRRGISDQNVLSAFEKVKRHLFVPPEHRRLAYADQPLPIGEGQTISQPYIVAYMTQALEPEAADRVLEIGTGSGYQAAILGEICENVYSIEIVPSLGKRARGQLNELGYDNVHVKIGDGYQGWPEHAPYDAIIITCAPTEVPAPLKEQLAEGGRMILPVGKQFSQDLVLLKKKGGELFQEKVLPVRFVPMVDDAGHTY